MRAYIQVEPSPIGEEHIRRAMAVDYRHKKAASGLFCVQGRPAFRRGAGNPVLGFDPENPSQGLFPTFLYETFHKGLRIGFHYRIYLL